MYIQYWNIIKRKFLMFNNLLFIILNTYVLICLCSKKLKTLSTFFNHHYVPMCLCGKKEKL